MGSIAVAFLLLLGNGSALAGDYEALLGAARSLEREGKHAPAAAAFERALASRRKDPEVEVELAGVYDQMEQYAKAASVYREALEARPADYALHIRLAQDYVWLGRLQDARAEFASARRAQGERSEAYIREGYADMAAGDDARAEQAFAGLIDRGSAEGYHHMAVLLLRRGKPAEAERYIRESVRRFEAQPLPAGGPELVNRLHALLWLGIIVERRGRAEEAESIYERGLSQAAAVPGFQASILNSLGRLHASQGRLREAEADFKRAVAVCQDPRRSCFPLAKALPMGGLAKLYADQGRSGEAVAAARAALFFWRAQAASWETGFVDVKGDAAGLDELGGILEKLGDVADAERAYRGILPSRRALLSSEQLQSAEAALASICRKSGRFAEAADFYRDARSIARRRAMERH